jgi:hypothetical protein
MLALHARSPEFNPPHLHSFCHLARKAQETIQRSWALIFLAHPGQRGSISSNHTPKVPPLFTHAHSRPGTIRLSLRRECCAAGSRIAHCQTVPSVDHLKNNLCFRVLTKDESGRIGFHCRQHVDVSHSSFLLPVMVVSAV